MRNEDRSDVVTKKPSSFAECGFNDSIDEAFSTLQATQIELSQMADSKANIMITVCSILLTLAAAQLQRDEFLLPSTIFAVFSALALFFAILCVMPSAKVPKLPKLNAKEVDLPKPFNLMFFMNFSQISVDKFREQLEAIMIDPQQLYDGLCRDIYHAGKVLADKKYRYLRWSYICLMAGICLSGFLFVLELI